MNAYSEPSIDATALIDYVDALIILACNFVLVPSNLSSHDSRLLFS